MGNEFEVYSRELDASGISKWVCHYRGEDRKEAMDAMETLASKGASYMQLDWRPTAR